MQIYVSRVNFILNRFLTVKNDDNMTLIYRHFVGHEKVDTYLVNYWDYERQNYIFRCALLK